MATVRKYRGKYVADFRDQHGRRRIETPRGTFETKALEKRAAGTQTIVALVARRPRCKKCGNVGVWSFTGPVPKRQ